MATNRPDTLDPALLRPGRLDRKIEFGLPDLEGRAHILTIHSKSMNVDRGIRFELIARLCPNTTGAELRSVCTEAGKLVSVYFQWKNTKMQKVLDPKIALIFFLKILVHYIAGNKKFSPNYTYVFGKTFSFNA